MRLFRPCFFAVWLYPEAIFRIKTSEKLLYLTFDDGPDPLSTPRLLNMLDRHSVKAVFFCDGKVAEKYPGLMNQIKSRGHLTGNHGFSHLNGWKTSLKKYIADITTAAQFTSVKIFRPPYGRLRIAQYIKLRKEYKIVFWDIMPYDFDIKFGSENSLRVLKKKIRSGSIIVLHDNHKFMNIEFIEEFILFASGKGYRFDNSLINDSVH